jgi:hypothetical protein
MFQVIAVRDKLTRQKLEQFRMCRAAFRGLPIIHWLDQTATHQSRPNAIHKHFGESIVVRGRQIDRQLFA